jgi:dTDP-4-amino-4,6-dideoxygalactose transaminase
MGIFSYQASKPMPAIEGGMGMYQEREDYERATTFGHAGLPRSFAEGSNYAKFQGTGLGVKFRIHPFAAALARCQLKGLQERNAAGLAQVRSLNDRIVQLPGLYEQTNGRADMTRLYYGRNMLFIDESQAGMSRATCVKALRAEGVHAGASRYRLQHKCALYAEANWWHHKPVIAELPGSEQANATAISLPYFTSEAPELVDQYAKAFEKVWAHRKDLA